MRIKIFIIFFIIPLFAVSQNIKNKINPNGYNIFYYPNGFKASEGYMKDGKPDGYWITYYVNGKKKSEGNRKNFLLDSIWIFYNELGDTTEKISYLYGKKNGWYIKYYTRLDSDAIGNIPKSKELYVDDKKQGKAYYYYPNGKLHYIIPYKDNYKYGTGYEYDTSGRLIAINEYRYNNLVEHRAVNRYNQNGQKQGVWLELYPDGKIKSEITYNNGMPDGVYKEYTPLGTVKKIEIYRNGKLISQSNKLNLKTADIQVIEEKYPNGKTKFFKTFRDSIPIGMHKYYAENGKLIKAIWYSDYGEKKGEGLIDSLGKKIGKWILYYNTGEKFAEGYYKNDLPDSLWIFYYRNGSIMQKGKYIEGYPVGKWIMYYPNGKVLKKEFYSSDGLTEGDYYEFSPEGDTIVKGKYENGKKTGLWYYKIGDEYSTGKYTNGLKDGVWLTYYMPDMQIKCKKKYILGSLNGKFKCFYKNGKLKVIGYYIDNKKSKKWYFYNPDGTLGYTITYKNDNIIKINDLPIK